MNLLNPIKSESGEVRVCRGCLATDCSLYDLREKRLEQTFSELTGLTASGGLLCSVCLHLLRKFSAYRMRCINTSYILQQIHLLTADVLSTVDRTHLKLNLKKSRNLYINCAYCPKNTVTLAKTDTLHITIPEETETPAFEGILKIETDPIDDHDASVKYENPLKDEDHLIDKNSEKQNDNAQTVFYDVDMTSLIDNSNNTNSDNIKESRDTEIDAMGTNIDDNSDDNFTEIGKQKTAETTKNTEELQKDRQLILEIVKLFTNIWRAVSKNDGDYYQMFERMHEESLHKNTIEAVDIKNKRNTREKLNFVSFLKLYKEVAELYNVDLEFLSIEEQRRVMDEKRQSANEEGQCNLCCKKYRTSETQDRHMKRSHDQSLPFKCEVCLYTFKKQPVYLLHLLKTHAVKATCRECGQTVAATSYRQHWDEARQHQEFHRGTVSTCEFCGRTFTAAKYCYMHIRSAHRAQMNAIQCLMCGDSYNGPVGLRRHIQWMHTAAIQCATCSVWFLNEDTFAAHTPDDSDCQPELSSCPLCGATFASAQLMREHYDERHARYKCAQCNLTFIELKSYKEHYYKLCSTGRRLPKQRGSETATKKKETPKINKDAQKPKQKQYVTNKKFICDVCGKSDFTCQAKLRYHQRIHTGEKPYKCEHCDKSFRMGPSLLVHMWTHTGERRYKCPHCPKAFRQQNHLRAHMPSHTNEKNYACTLCKKRFTAGGTLRQHIRTVHEGMPPRYKNRQKKKTPEQEYDEQIDCLL